MVEGRQRVCWAGGLQGIGWEAISYSQSGLEVLEVSEVEPIKQDLAAEDWRCVVSLHVWHRIVELHDGFRTCQDS